jgi:hypothetical protein
MSLIKCPNINEAKEYMLPTKNWLKPIEKLMLENEVATKGQIYVADLIKKGKIIVKITGIYGEKSEKIKQINESLFNFPNMVKTYCTFNCKDDFLLIEKNKQFCNNTEKGHNVTLELMKRYAMSLSAVKISIKEMYLSAMLQLSFAQINIFSKFGYTHNDTDKFRKETIKLVEKYVYDYYNIIKDVF